VEAPPCKGEGPAGLWDTKGHLRLRKKASLEEADKFRVGNVTKTKRGKKLSGGPSSNKKKPELNTYLTRHGLNRENEEK